MEIKNLNKEDVMEIVEKGFPLKPLFNKVCITLNTEKVQDENDLQLTTNIFSETQYIVAVGHGTQHLKEGDKVLIDVEKLMVPVRQERNNSYEDIKQVKINMFDVDGNPFAFIDDRVITAIDNR